MIWKRLNEPLFCWKNWVAHLFLSYLKNLLQSAKRPSPPHTSKNDQHCLSSIARSRSKNYDIFHSSLRHAFIFGNHLFKYKPLLSYFQWFVSIKCDKSSLLQSKDRAPGSNEIQTDVIHELLSSSFEIRCFVMGKVVNLPQQNPLFIRQTRLQH